MKLESETLPVSELTEPLICEMLRLMQTHYEGVVAEQFNADLRAKQWVILMRTGGRLCGFSTQVSFSHTVLGQTVQMLYSGDTIIEKDCWGSLALPLAWGRLMLSIIAEYPEQKLYWLLTSKGYKTYRFLPVFFREFQPCFSTPASPFEQALLQSAAIRMAGGRFDPVAGILRAPLDAQRLRPGVADLEPQRLHDPHIAFFQKMNPGHARGDELVCLARFHRDNLSPFINRQL
jgi:hypothetical protein